MRASSVLPLNWNEEVRDTTRRAGIWVRALISSSAMPSQKYSWSFWGLMSTKGRTATDACCAAGAASSRTCVSARLSKATGSPPRRAASARASSLVVAKRFFGSFWRQVAMTRCRPSGTAGLRSVAGTGSSNMMAASVPLTESR